MGMDFYVYVGPFVRAPRVNVVGRKNVAVCSENRQHHISSGARFCAVCGNAVVGESQPTSTVTEAWPPEIEGRPEWVDAMTCVGEGDTRFWLPNRRGFGVNLSETGNSSPHVLGPKTVDEALQAFRLEYGDYLKAAGAELGATLVVEYGVVPYSS